MASQTASPLGAGQILEIRFPTFTPRITIHFDRELTVEIVAGDNSGFFDLSSMRQSRSAMAWSFSHGSNTSEAQSCTLDLNASETYAVVTPAKGEFMGLMDGILLRPAYDY